MNRLRLMNRSHRSFDESKSFAQLDVSLRLVGTE